MEKYILKNKIFILCFHFFIFRELLLKRKLLQFQKLNLFIHINDVNSNQNQNKDNNSFNIFDENENETKKVKPINFRKFNKENTDLNINDNLIEMEIDDICKKEESEPSFFDQNFNTSKSTLTSICSISERFNRISRTLSFTQKILLCSGFIASELDIKYDEKILRACKRTEIRKKKVT